MLKLHLLVSVGNFVYVRLVGLSMFLFLADVIGLFPRVFLVKIKIFFEFAVKNKKFRETTSVQNKKCRAVLIGC